ncbi:hypothetical protein SH1V18_15970 [Vallitalea longa]|uniref:EamA domain-containing protein n=1 Tax=Vallitalea longa TaxID=2936439 RepID=A0A9W6DF50_9FIRM|nr:DMT family transporter [Vallitalea longa]GKX29117.1 hypothetical protein SH1V18_15970 [Vallitalea longa]
MNKYSTKFVRLILLFVALLYGINPTVVKLGIKNMPALTFTTLRLLVATISFLILLNHSKTYKKVKKADVHKFIFMGLGGLVFQLGLIYGLKYVTAATASTIIAVMPISVMMINRFVKHKIIEKNKYIGAIITMMGIFLITQNGVNYNYDSNTSKIGIILLLIAQLAAAIYTVISEDLVKRYSHYQVSTIMFGLVFLGFIIISSSELIRLDINLVPLTGWVCILYGGIFSLCIANTLWIFGVEKIGSNETSIYNNLPPVFSLLSGMIILNEKPLYLQIIGIFIVTIGMYIFSKNRDKIDG